MIRFVSLRHSVTYNRDKPIFLQMNKSKADVFWDLNIRFKYFVCLNTNQSIASVLSFSLKLFQTKVDIKIVIRDYSLRNYVLNV